MGPRRGGSAGSAPSADDDGTRWEHFRATAIQLGAVSLGGGLGALSRWGITAALPRQPGEPAWAATALVNVLGCFALGVVMVLVIELWSGRRLVRLFLGVGVLGGFTTFSTYVVDAYQLVEADAAGPALGYLAGTVVAALLATMLGLVVARTALRSRRAR